MPCAKRMAAASPQRGPTRKERLGLFGLRPKRLKTEHALDLVPDDDGERDADPDQGDEHEPEPEAGAADLALSLTVSTPAGAV